MTNSADETDVDEYLREYECVISDWKSAVDLINGVIDGNQTLGTRKLAWRGLANSKFWPDHSLYRLLQKRNANLSGPEAGRPPFEVDLRKFESELLNQARSRWRFDHFSALEIFARIRHYGGPTRLLDVTFNPLIALWFAVEKQFDEAGQTLPEIDGRLFAFDVTDGEISLDPDWSGRELPWESAALVRTREFNQDEPHWIWKPPSYNDRIPAQNSAFLIGRVPSEVELRWKYFVDSEFQTRLNSVRALVSRVQERIQEVKEIHPGISGARKFARNLEILRRMVPDFSTLSEIGKDVDELTMASQAIEASETGVIFTPRLLSLETELEILKNNLGEYSEEDAKLYKANYDDFISSGADEDFESFDAQLLETLEDFFHNLDWFADEIEDTKDWISGRGDARKSASIGMRMTKIDDLEPPNSFTTYTIRISATAKPEIREALERGYGYNASTIYPDIMGLAEKGANLI
jgi:hypothetical protein